MMSYITKAGSTIKIVLLIAVWGLFIPNITLAQPDDTAEAPGPDDTAQSDAPKLKNPLAGTVDSIPAFIQELLDIVLIIGVPIVAVMIIYSGFLLVTAQGDTEKLKQGKQGLLWTLVGAIIVLGARVIANAIEGTIQQLQ